VDPTLGVAYNTSGFKSVWLTLGSDFFFLYQIGLHSSNDQTVYFPQLDSTVTKYWNDERLSDIEKQLNWSVGIGGRVSQNWAVYVDTGITRIQVRYQFKDETHTLANENGLYSYPKKTMGKITCNVGALFPINTHLKGRVSVSILDKPFHSFEAGVGVNLYK